MRISRRSPRRYASRAKILSAGWSGVTSADGRVETLTPESAALEGGLYRLVYDTRRYFEEKGMQTFFPSVIITFQVESHSKGRSNHYHVPLLLSPFGYTTYRGS